MDQNGCFAIVKWKHFGAKKPVQNNCAKGRRMQDKTWWTRQSQDSPSNLNSDSHHMALWLINYADL